MMASSTSYDADSGSERTTQQNNGDISGKHEPGRLPSTGLATGKAFPTNFRIVPNTERIESLDKEGVQRLFTLRFGSRTVHTDAFSLKSARMTFLEPPVSNVPKFVEQAMEEYNQALAAYRQNQLDLEKIADELTDKDKATTPTIAVISLPMPKPSPFIRQYSLRNLRQYPATVDSPHPPYRVVYVIPKKTVSKLAIHRNLCRKKLSAAVETVFREHARPGFEYMFFAKQQCVTTPQTTLEEMLIKTLKDPNLYPDKATSFRNKGRSTSCAKPIETSTSLPSPPPILQESSIRVKPVIKVRWKNNRPPLKWNWWQHALPHPLGRTHQADEYLDMHSQKLTEESTLDGRVCQEKTKPARAKK
ncbi:hypothetical protein BGW39_004422 [Mortierella sp. 14UC]|nr:hypothetical protein BGW39_004422 [Mortierella sp. 14UC]